VPQRRFQIGGPAEARRLLRSSTNASAPPITARTPTAPPTTAPIGSWAAAAAATGDVGDVLLLGTSDAGALVACGVGGNVGNGVDAMRCEGVVLGRRLCGAREGAAEGTSDGDDDGELSTGEDDG